LSFVKQLLSGPVFSVDRKQVLCMDDDDAIANLTTHLLERRGYHISRHTDALAAVAAVHAEPGRFDSAVTDYSIPGMSGLQVASALREIRADLPVALAIGYITDELRKHAPAAGVRELIYKPRGFVRGRGML
jgi:two-component system cell cycle sensor histidine kinase/response regulator CckA